MGYSSDVYINLKNAIKQEIISDKQYNLYQQAEKETNKIQQIAGAFTPQSGYNGVPTYDTASIYTRLETLENNLTTLKNVYNSHQHSVNIDGTYYWTSIPTPQANF